MSNAIRVQDVDAEPLSALGTSNGADHTAFSTTRGGWRERKANPVHPWGLRCYWEWKSHRKCPQNEQALLSPSKSTPSEDTAMFNFEWHRSKFNSGSPPAQARLIKEGFLVHEEDEALLAQAIGVTLCMRM
ncbi:hypothetical protein TREES_T100021043 [Tupaia chinensis]|uniref:Uncharacterized protein n=1 Tax=Tupaia chinensis TaxID=246437 RepID=L9JET4_TUPCH|nr:hypothetical protein TREES_T100021043 [Tupaia chinensis]